MGGPPSAFCTLKTKVQGSAVSSAMLLPWSCSLIPTLTLLLSVLLFALPPLHAGALEGSCFSPAAADVRFPSGPKLGTAAWLMLCALGAAPLQGCDLMIPPKDASLATGAKPAALLAACSAF